MIQYRRIGDMLVRKGLITPAKLEKALAAQVTSNLRFGELLTTLGFVSEADITMCLSDQFGYPVVDPSTVVPEPEAIALLDLGFAMAHLLLPVAVKENEIQCVVADPLEIFATDSLERRVGKRLTLSLAPRTQLADAIARAYGAPVTESRYEAAPKEKGKGRKKKIDGQPDRQALLEALTMAVETRRAS